MADVRSSGVDKQSIDGESPVQLCNYMDVYLRDRVHPGPELMRATATQDEVTRFRLEVGDSLITKDSEDRMDIGVSAFVDSTSDDFVCGYHLAIVRPHGVHARYLNWCLRGREVMGYWSSQATGVTRYGLGLQGIKSAPLHLPEQDEQSRVADFLDDRVARIDRIIAARREQVSRTSVLIKRQVMDVLLHNGVRTLKLASLWTVIDCKHRTPDYVDAGYPVVSPGDVIPGRLDLRRAARFVTEEDYLDLADDLRRCRRGDIIYSRNASAGTAAYVDTDEPFTMGQDVCRITSTGGDQLYLAYCLNYLCEPQLESLKVGATFTRINLAQIKGLSIPVPPLTQQRQIAAGCDDVVHVGERVTQELTRSIELLSEYRESLITAAVTGDLDVTTAGSRIPA